MQNMYNKLHYSTPVFAGIKSVKHGILAIAEEHIHMLDKCVPM
jgi:hypothetical protein